ncbi:hypothetical protein T484DRAFT_1851085 [Baffinella frigidus]|nr:hypothetical protein T484DRAFT_1851085 [Cryptophyta sp. CCMP2293]
MEAGAEQVRAPAVSGTGGKWNTMRDTVRGHLDMASNLDAGRAVERVEVAHHLHSFCASPRTHLEGRADFDQGSMDSFSDNMAHEVPGSSTEDSEARHHHHHHRHHHHHHHYQRSASSLAPGQAALGQAHSHWDKLRRSLHLVIDLASPRTSTVQAVSSRKKSAYDALIVDVEEDPAACPAELNASRWRQAWLRRKSGATLVRMRVKGGVFKVHDFEAGTRRHLLPRSSSDASAASASSSSSLLQRSSSGEPGLAGLTSYYKFMQAKYFNVGASSPSSSTLPPRETPQPGDFLFVDRAGAGAKRRTTRTLGTDALRPPGSVEGGEGGVMSGRRHEYAGRARLRWPCTGPPRVAREGIATPALGRRNHPAVLPLRLLWPLATRRASPATVAAKW